MKWATFFVLSVWIFVRFLHVAHVLIILILDMNFVTVFGFCRIFLFGLFFFSLCVACSSNVNREMISEEKGDRRGESNHTKTSYSCFCMFRAWTSANLRRVYVFRMQINAKYVDHTKLNRSNSNRINNIHWNRVGITNCRRRQNRCRAWSREIKKRQIKRKNLKKK